MPLAPVREPALVGSAIAQALGAPETATQAAEAGVAGFLRDRRALLALDNFEHLLDAGPFVAGLLSVCPSLTVLVTSRAMLRLSGEHAIAVPPLSLPSRTAGDGLPAPSPSLFLDASEAVRLFVERAQAVRADFALTADNAAAVAEICRRLDGLPLAIELAAARVNHMPLPALLHRLQQRLPVLTAGARDLPTRLQTMRDAIAWSYDLLDEGEQALFRRLAVFVGGFTLDAAEWVGGRGSEVGGTSERPSSDSRLPTPDSVLDRIASLVDKSLLRQETEGEGEPRYGMLETVREYGLEQLAAADEEDETRARHAGYFLQLSAHRGEGIEIQWSLDAVQRVAADRDNVRQALAWCDEHEAFDDLLQLSTWLFVAWTSPSQEGWSWIDRALTRSRHVASAARVRALNGAAVLAMFQGDYARAATYVAAELNLAQALGDAYLTGEALINTGMLSYRRGEYAAAEAWLDEALRTLDEPARTDPAAILQTVRAFLILGDTALVQTQFERAGERYTEALSRAPETAMDWGLSDTQAGLASASYCLGDLPQAAALYAASLARAQRALAAESLNRIQDRSYTPVVLSVLLGLAGIVAEAGRPEQGARLLGDAEAIAVSHGVAIFPRDQPVRERSLVALRRSLGDELQAAMAQPDHAPTIEQAVADAVALLGEVTPLLAQMAPPPATVRSATHGFTLREMDIVRLVAAGYSNREIAEALFISVPTVKRHLSNVLGKLGLPSRSALNTYAHTHGLG